MLWKEGQPIERCDYTMRCRMIYKKPEKYEFINYGNQSLRMVRSEVLFNNSKIFKYYDERIHPFI